MMELLAICGPPIGFITLFVGFIVRLVQTWDQRCDKCHGHPYNSVTYETCGACNNGWKR
jgi:hypothetical protein